MLRTRFGVLVLVLAVLDVTSWTIDLPEARKYLFEKNDRLEKERREEKQHETEISKQIYFSNRYDSNSKHHEEPHEDHEDYAKDYGYQSYMEKKVHGTGWDGSAYAGGLQRALERFSELLENCTRDNRTNARFRFNETAFNASSFNSASYNFTSDSSTAEPWRPTHERAPYNDTNSPNATDAERCRRLTRASEHVRRLAELALKATKDLQDIAYSRKYMKDDPDELSKEENELILKLAWFLDRLAYYTDFHPQPRRYLHDDYSTSTTPALPPPLPNPLNATADTKRMMMNCLKQKSDVPATIRCAYPQQIPSMPNNITNNSTPGDMPSSSNREVRVFPPSPPATSEQELLIATDHRSPYRPYHHLTAITHVKKRSAPEPEGQLSKSENPAITFMKYFVKHKVWEYSNPTQPDRVQGLQQFEVNNEISHRTKRAADGKKLELPEDPFQDLSKYIRNKKGVNYVKDDAQARRIKAFVQKILYSKPSTAKEHSRRIAKLFRSKRSYTYERDVDKPRKPEDLFKDISYYVKNKPGTSYNRDAVQAAQLRAGLTQIFLNPNIETVRRYAANFNPLVPDPLLLGAIRGTLDN